MASTATGSHPSQPPRWRRALIAWALVADLILTFGVALVVAPVSTTEAVLDSYDAMPRSARELLGDRPGTETESDSRTAGAGTTRGPVGSWLAEWHRAALEGDVEAQLARGPDAAADLDADAWSSADSVMVSWVRYGDELGYEVAVTSVPASPSSGWQQATGGSASAPLGVGDNWVHVRGTFGSEVGKVTTLGPFMVDRTPPPAPAFTDGARVTVGDYRFTLSWAPVADVSGIVGYRLERSVNGVEFERAATLDASVTEWTELNRPNGHYWYRVLAVNGAGLETSDPSALRVTVDATSNLAKPETGTWHYGFNATYDSVVHLWDISDPGRYAHLTDIHGPGHAGLSPAQYARYTGPGWGLTTDNATLQGIVDDVVGDETNSMRIAMLLYEWLFDATDYDFDKFAATEQNFLPANEVLDAGGGICGDLTSLYLTVLRIAGVPGRPVHGYLINTEDGIGGFHMWAEVFVGGQDRDATGNGFITVDVSGVTGAFEPKFLDIYFGIANPSYLALGVQEDLGDPADPKATNSKWNVWANLKWEFVSDGSPPTIDFDADAVIREDLARSSDGRLYFNDATHQRVFCETRNGDLVDPGCGDGFRTYFDGLRGRSVRHMDYGADLSWSSDKVTKLWLHLKMPETPAPNQAVIFTAYRHDASCRAFEVAPTPVADGFLTWEIQGGQAPCSR